MVQIGSQNDRKTFFKKTLFSYLAFSSQIWLMCGSSPLWLQHKIDQKNK
jgi:hypothetical protein